MKRGSGGASRAEAGAEEPALSCGKNRLFRHFDQARSIHSADLSAIVFRALRQQFVTESRRFVPPKSVGVSLGTPVRIFLLDDKPPKEAVALEFLRNQQVSKLVFKLGHRLCRPGVVFRRGAYPKQ